MTKIFPLIFQSRQLTAIFAAFFKKWLFYRHFCAEPDEAFKPPSAFKRRNNEFKFLLAKVYPVDSSIGRLPLLLLA